MSIMSSSSSENEEIVNKKKRGIRNDENYTKVKGLSHENHVGELIPERKTGPNCMCRQECFDLSEDIKDNIIKRINDFNTKNEQDIYLQSLIKVNSVQDTSKRMEIDSEEDPNSKKSKLQNFSYKYYVEINGNEKLICKKAFLSLHGVTDKRIRRLKDLKVKNKIPHDERGKSAGSRSNIVPGEKCALIHRFVESIPVKEIHYSNNIVTRYLSSSLNTKILHEGYCLDHPHQKVTYQFFKSYFNKKFDLKFGRPQIDVCSKCEEIKVRLKTPHMDENSKNEANIELESHKSEASKFFKEATKITKECQKQGSTIMGLTFD